MKFFQILLIILALLMFNIKQNKESLIRSKSKHVVNFTMFGRIYGTGFHITYKGLNVILTNKHVCKAGLKYGISKDSVNVKRVKSKIIKMWYNHDLCAVETNRKGGLKLSLDTVHSLDKVILIGHPRGLPLTIRQGRVIGKDIICFSLFNCNHAIQISATAYPGNSGSPVLNEEGNVIGVLFAGSLVYVHEPFIVPHKYIKQFLEEFIEDALSEKRNQ